MVRADQLDCEVIVVGAGPTGLMAANLLKRSGVDVRIVEQRAEATRESRAFAVQARTLELMRALGLADRFIARGVIADSVNIHVRGRWRGGLDFARAEARDTPYPFILMIPQSETEAILAEDCARLGIVIERGTTTTAVALDEAGVSVTLRGLGGEQIARAAFVIGADGSRSIVRSEAGLAWNGEMLPQRFLLADCKVDWPLDHEKFRVFLNGRLLGLFLPLDGKRLSRVMATDLSGAFGDEDASVPAPLDLSEMQEGLAAALALPVKLSDPVWVTRYRAHHRFTDRYSAGRAFVAGDAAHIHSPAGGQGMNTGLQDAANLAWKLAATLRRAAPEALLDSYDSERRPVGEAVVRSTGKLFAAAAGQAGWKAWLRDRLIARLLPILSRAKPFQKKAFLNSSQRAIAYPRGPFVDGAAARKVGPGARAPDAWIADGCNLFDLIEGYKFTVLVLSRPGLDAPERARLDGLRGRDDLAVRAVVGVDSHAPDVIRAGSDEIFDRYGVADGGTMICLIRPDGYLAWRGEGLDVDSCSAFLERFGFERSADRRASEEPVHAP